MPYSPFILALSYPGERQKTTLSDNETNFLTLLGTLPFQLFLFSISPAGPGPSCYWQGSLTSKLKYANCYGFCARTSRAQVLWLQKIVQFHFASEEYSYLLLPFPIMRKIIPCRLIHYKQYIYASIYFYFKNERLLLFVTHILPQGQYVQIYAHTFKDLVNVF